MRDFTQDLREVQRRLDEAEAHYSQAERIYGAVFDPSQTSQMLSDIYLRHYPATQTYLGTLGGRLYALDPAFGPDVVDLGPLGGWLSQALAAGF